MSVNATYSIIPFAAEHEPYGRLALSRLHMPLILPKTDLREEEQLCDPQRDENRRPFTNPIIFTERTRPKDKDTIETTLFHIDLLSFFFVWG